MNGGEQIYSTRRKTVVGKKARRKKKGQKKRKKAHGISTRLAIIKKKKFLW